MINRCLKGFPLNFALCKNFDPASKNKKLGTVAL